MHIQCGSTRESSISALSKRRARDSSIPPLNTLSNSREGPSQNIYHSITNKKILTFIWAVKLFKIIVESKLKRPDVLTARTPVSVVLVVNEYHTTFILELLQGHLYQSTLSRSPGSYHGGQLTSFNYLTK